MSASQKIAEIEAEMARTQKNKATMHHLCLLKAKLAKYKRELLDAATIKGKLEYLITFRRWRRRRLRRIKDW